MRKAILVVAVMLAAGLATAPNVAIAADDPNQNTHNFIRDALNPYGATSQPASHMHQMHDMHRHGMQHHRMHHRHRHAMHRKHYMRHGGKPHKHGKM